MKTIDEEMKKYIVITKNEIIRLQQQINGVKSDKTQLQLQYVAQQRKIADIELTLGVEQE